MITSELLLQITTSSSKTEIPQEGLGRGKHALKCKRVGNMPRRVRKVETCFGYGLG